MASVPWAKNLGKQFGEAGAESGERFGDAFTRDASGRLHDQRGRFAKAGTDTGEALGEGITEGAKASVGKLGASLQTSFGNMQMMGAKMSLAITAPLTLFAKQSLHSFSEFEDASAAATVFYGEQVSEIEKFAGTSATSDQACPDTALD